MLKLTNELVSSYEKLVYSIISKYSNESNKDDLFQAGMVGIIDASNKYDDSSNVKFTSFAYKYILGEVLKYLREDRNIKISRDLISDYRKIMIAKDHIYKTYGRPISDDELSKILNINKERISEAIRFHENEVSLNKIVKKDDRDVLLEDMVYKVENVNKEEIINLKDALYELEENEKKLIYKRYFENMSQTEFAKQNNMSQVKVYRYEKKILDKLKDKMS